MPPPPDSSGPSSAGGDLRADALVDRGGWRPRSLVTAGEYEGLLDQIDRKLGRVGIETQPEVAARVLDLTTDPNAGIREYAEVVKTDMVLTGRLLRVANSAYYAQRKPVTNLNRACVVLGIERLKAISLGFYLSRAAATDESRQLSRRVWGQSVYRACLAAEITRLIRPEMSAEAFVVGLMLDSGVPLLWRMVGEPYTALLEQDDPPTRQFRAEFDRLPYTHVDVVATLCRRWRMPETLAKPIAWHHTAPPERTSEETEDPIGTLHRVAYYAGAVALGPRGTPREACPLPLLAERHLGLSPRDLARTYEAAFAEYSAIWRVFESVADGISDVGDLADRVHNHLLAAIEDSCAASLTDETSRAPERFQVGGTVLEVEPAANGEAVVYLRDSRGMRVLSHRFRARQTTAAGLLDTLGVEAAAGDTSVEEIEAYLRSLAA